MSNHEQENVVNGNGQSYTAQAAALRAEKTLNPPRHPIDIDYKTVTEVANAYNEKCPNPRMKSVLASLVKHLHDFARENALTSEEWMQGIEFLTQTGQACTNTRQEFILLSDVLGLSALVDSLNHPKPDKATESTVLGPFFTTDAHDLAHGQSICSDEKMAEGEPMFVHGRVLDTEGNPIPGAVIETWETDASGHYDTQYSDRSSPDCRGRLRSSPEGEYMYRAIKPVSYPIPDDGPVGQMLLQLGRHVYRPSHLHIWITAEGFEPLVTALYPKDDKYLYSDTVFGVKSSLIVTPQLINDAKQARVLGFKSDSYLLLKQDFTLCTSVQADAMRSQVAGKVRSST